MLDFHRGQSKTNGNTTETSLSLGTQSSCYNIKPKPRFYSLFPDLQVTIHHARKTKLGTGNTAQRKKKNFKRRNLPKPRYHVFSTYTNRQVTILHAKKDEARNRNHALRKKTRHSDPEHCLEEKEKNEALGSGTLLKDRNKTRPSDPEHCLEEKKERLVGMAAEELP